MSDETTGSWFVFGNERRAFVPAIRAWLPPTAMVERAGQWSGHRLFSAASPHKLAGVWAFCALHLFLAPGVEYTDEP